MPGARRGALLLSASVLLLAVVVLSLTVGARAINPLNALAALFDPDAPDAEVIRSLRVPRTVVGLVVGAGLAVAGVIMQALTRNPLADPRILGVSAGASLGVVLAMSVFGLSLLTQYVWFGIAGALVAGMAGYLVAARSRDGASPVTLALAGAALDASIGGAVYAILAASATTFDGYRFWVAGSLAGRTPQIALQVAPFLIAGLLLAAWLARGLDALVLGGDMAAGLGHKVARVRLAGAFAVALLTGAAVAAAGPIGFIGLAIPHLARALVGGAHRWILALSLILGPVMLLSADVIGRVVLPTGEVPAGIVTAVIGAPLLIVLVRRARLVAA
ncbi:FecCD family ABC transporter permease [Phytomonospora endophytica]|uniref:Iron complex transport system permease protein n=1 Tax=Phytomonospora endophytica TaxID=714109 RepID=A0A841FJV6_9ACTN|nr:iron ABC transporter permease [Phytomonospora endophytica]MBB6033842.1 iron complex transport system permease protein [Phytomonospora endophytica]GIG64639.1 iron ABC transporter permease [Phytomonospora endophytica]